MFWLKVIFEIIIYPEIKNKCLKCIALFSADVFCALGNREEQKRSYGFVLIENI